MFFDHSYHSPLSFMVRHLLYSVLYMLVSSSLSFFGQKFYSTPYILNTICCPCALSHCFFLLKLLPSVSCNHETDMGCVSERKWGGEFASISPRLPRANILVSLWFFWFFFIGTKRGERNNFPYDLPAINFFIIVSGNVVVVVVFVS